MRRLPGSLPHLAAAAVFLLLLAKPAYMAALRREFKAALPGAWERLPTNGGFAILVPELMGGRWHDEALYASKARQVLLRGLPYNPYTREDRRPSSWSTDIVLHFAMAGFAALCGGDMNLGWLLATAVVGTAWFWLFYAVFRWWCGKDEAAVPLALFSILFPDVYPFLLDLNLSLSVNLERWAAVFFQHHAAIRPHFYRLPSQFLSLLLLCALLLGTWRLSAETRRRPGAAALAGLGFALMRFVHPFEYAFGMALLLFWTLLARRERTAARWNLLAAFLVSLAGAGLYAWEALSGWGAGGTLDFAELVPTRRFLKVTVVHLAFAAWGWSRARREASPGRRQAWLLLCAAQLAAFSWRNAQVALGFWLQPLHYITLGSFFGTAMLALAGAEALARRPSWDGRLGLAASAALLLLGLSNEKAGAERNYLFCGLPRHVEEAAAWAGRALPPGGLVLSLSVETNEVVPLYTRQFVQVPAIGVNFSGPFTREEYLGRVARLLKTCDADVEAFIARRWLLSPEKEALRGRLYRRQLYLGETDPEAMEAAQWFMPYFSEAGQERIPAEQERLRRLVEAAEPVEGPFHLWVNAKDRPLLRRPPEALGGKLVFENPSVRIYSFPGPTGGAENPFLERGRTRRAI